MVGRGLPDRELQSTTELWHAKMIYGQSTQAHTAMGRAQSRSAQQQQQQKQQQQQQQRGPGACLLGPSWSLGSGTQ